LNGAFGAGGSHLLDGSFNAIQVPTEGRTPEAIAALLADRVREAA